MRFQFNKILLFIFFLIGNFLYAAEEVKSLSQDSFHEVEIKIKEERAKVLHTRANNVDELDRLITHYIEMKKKEAHEHEAEEFYNKIYLTPSCLTEFTLQELDFEPKRVVKYGYERILGPFDSRIRYFFRDREKYGKYNKYVAAFYNDFHADVKNIYHLKKLIDNEAQESEKRRISKRKKEIEDKFKKALYNSLYHNARLTNNSYYYMSCTLVTSCLCFIPTWIAICYLIK